jgi:hypothetical protein
MSLIKASDRTLRQSCKTCGQPGSELYWGNDTDRPYEFVLLNRTPETLAAKKGDKVPAASLHPCIIEDADPLAENRHRVMTLTVSARISIDVPWS